MVTTANIELYGQLNTYMNEFVNTIMQDQILLKFLYYNTHDDVLSMPDLTVEQKKSMLEDTIFKYKKVPVRNDGEMKYTLFDIFIEKVYLLYLAETPEHIKMMLFNYESGYDVDGYFSSNKKKIKKSAIHFITSYVRNKLWIRYSENDANRTLICNDDYNDPHELDNRLKIYDDIKLRQVNLDIYHTTDNSVEMEKYLQILHMMKGCCCCYFSVTQSGLTF